jgi:hypothetical protein
MQIVHAIYGDGQPVFHRREVNEGIWKSVCTLFQWHLLFVICCDMNVQHHEMGFVAMFTNIKPAFALKKLV